MRKSRTGVLGAMLLALILVLGACGSGGDDDEADGAGGGGGESTESKGSITVGSDAFPEAQIVGEMYAQVLENDGWEVERQLDLESREVRLPAMENGEVNVAPEYLASLLSVIDPKATVSTDPAEVSETLQPLLEEMGLQVLDYSDAVDTNAFVVTQETSDEFGLSSVSDLAGPAADMTLGGPAECPERPFCIPGLKDVYGVEFGDFKPLEYGAATAQALQAGAVDVALLFSTDPLIQENELVLLEDDKHLQAADNITPLVTADVAADVEGVLQPVTDALTTEEMTELNARVAIDQEDAADVAADFLGQNGLLD
jgi:osmoprotectant transport system substrate-binding protein